MAAGRGAPDRAAAIHGACTPRRSNVPKVGFHPTVPQNEAGRITDPAVCEPSAAGTIRSATAAAEPLDDPPGVRAGSRGLRVFPPRYAANSVVTVFPGTTAPAARSAATHAASAFGRWPA